MLRGGVALRWRRLPVDRLEYSHADVPVAQGGGGTDNTLKLIFIATRYLTDGALHLVLPFHGASSTPLYLPALPLLISLAALQGRLEPTFYLYSLALNTAT